MSRQGQSRGSDGGGGFLIDLFRSYYRQAQLKLPEDMEFREFALQPFNMETYIRHLSFKTRDELKMYISRNVPLHIYYSSAIYLFPYMQDMEDKSWRGSDLIFDIDADGVEGCTIYRYFLYEDCGLVEDGEAGGCRGPPVSEIEIVSEDCIREVFLYSLDLVDVLVHELGFDRGNIELVFSGNRGFHVRYFNDPDVRGLDRDERKTIAGYIALPREYIDSRVLASRGTHLDLPSLRDGGVRARLVRGFMRRARERIRRRVLTYLTGDNVPLEVPAEDINELKAVVNELRSGRYGSIPIDEQVTIDISRLIRITYSINGKSGLMVAPIDPVKADFEYSEKLSPFADRVFRFRSRYRIPSLKLFGYTVKLAEGSRADLEGPVAVYLALKGLGDILGDRR